MEMSYAHCIYLECILKVSWDSTFPVLSAVQLLKLHPVAPFNLHCMFTFCLAKGSKPGSHITINI